MKKITIILTFFVILFSSSTLAHSGRTDSSGGHYNRSTGEYHYHHDYPAHQHINGLCPYYSNNFYTTQQNDTKGQELQERFDRIVENANTQKKQEEQKLQERFDKIVENANIQKETNKETVSTSYFINNSSTSNSLDNNTKLIFHKKELISSVIIFICFFIFFIIYKLYKNMQKR